MPLHLAFDVWYKDFLTMLNTYPLCDKIRFDAELLRDIIPKCLNCEKPCWKSYSTNFKEFYRLSQKFDRIISDIYTLELEVKYADFPEVYKKSFLNAIHTLFNLVWTPITRRIKEVDLDGFLEE